MKAATQLRTPRAPCRCPTTFASCTPARRAYARRDRPPLRLHPPRSSCAASTSPCATATGTRSRGRCPTWKFISATGSFDVTSRYATTPMTSTSRGRARSREMPKAASPARPRRAGPAVQPHRHLRPPSVAQETAATAPVLRTARSAPFPDLIGPPVNGVYHALFAAYDRLDVSLPDGTRALRVRGRPGRRRTTATGRTPTSRRTPRRSRLGSDLAHGSGSRSLPTAWRARRAARAPSGSRSDRGRPCGPSPGRGRRRPRSRPSARSDYQPAHLRVEMRLDGDGWRDVLRGAAGDGVPHRRPPSRCRSTCARSTQSACLPWRHSTRARTSIACS